MYRHTSQKVMPKCRVHHALPVEASVLICHDALCTHLHSSRLYQIKNDTATDKDGMDDCSRHTMVGPKTGIYRTWVSAEVEREKGKWDWVCSRMWIHVNENENGGRYGRDALISS